MPEEHVATKVKRLREAVGLSFRAAAKAMKLAPSSYGHYEDPGRLKGPYLPPSFAIPFARLIADAGGRADDVMALMGAEGMTPEPAAPADMVPIYDIEVSAGPGLVPSDAEVQVDALAFPPGYLRRITSAPLRDLAILTVKGDSMSPTLREGDVVMIDRSKTNLGYDGLFVLRFNGALSVKRVTRGTRRGTILLLSDNRAHYPPQESELTEVDAVGKVLWYGRKE